MSLAIIASSAIAGQPGKPIRAETLPSFICALTVNLGSCACWAIIPLNVFTYSSALRIINGSETHLPSSLKIRTLAIESAIAPNSASCSPCKPFVTAPIGFTSTNPAALPSLNTCSTTPAVSATGLVLAIADMAVKPPATAAIEPVKTVSESSRPGSRRCV